MARLERGDWYTHKVMYMAHIGMWVLDFPGDGTGKLLGDEAMLELLGVDDSLSEEELFQLFFDNVYPEDMPALELLYAKARTGDYAEARFRWKHKTLGVIYLYCGVLLNLSYEECPRYEGILQNVTDMIKARNKITQANAVSQMFMTRYQDIVYVDLNTGIGEGFSFTDNERSGAQKPFFQTMQNYIITAVAPEDQFAMQLALNPEVIRTRLKKDDQYVTDFCEVGNGRPTHKQMIIVRGGDENHIAISCLNVEKEYRESRIQESVLAVMSNFFVTLLYVESTTDELTICKMTDKVKSIISDSLASNSYAELREFLLNNLVSPEESQRLRPLLEKNSIVEKLARVKHYTIDFDLLIGRNKVPYQINLTADPNREGVAGFVMGFMRRES